MSIGVLVGGRYRLLEQVGAGGMATVHRARDERLNRDVAVKLIGRRFAQDVSFVRCFRREAELCARVGHPNVVAVLDAGSAPRSFTVMEFVAGLDSGALLRDRAPLTPGETVHILAQVCDGLACVHDHGVLHRDVTPRNIVLTGPGGIAKLTDFGLATCAGDAVPTRPADLAGTPGYVAPEVLAGAAPTPQSDLYSLGAVAYRFLAGLPRLRRPDPDATSAMATADPRTPPLRKVRPDLAGALIRAVDRAMARSPEDRQPSAADFGAELIGAVSPPVAPRRGLTALPQAA
jgi:serine/threonine-protein kinase